MKVGELMSRDVVTLTEVETLAHAQRCMSRGRLRHLPVIREGGRLVGLVTHRDLLAASFSVFAEIEPDEQHRDVVSVTPETPVADAARILLCNKYGCLPVVDSDGRLVGIVTEADFLRLTVRLLP